MRILTAIILTLISFYSTMAAAAQPTGVWVTKDGKSLINIAACNGSLDPKAVLCSKIIWLKKPFNEKGEPLRDKINSNPKLRRRPILGMPILLNMRPSKGGWEGKVYNPEDGNVYRAVMEVKSSQRLLVKGCAKVLFNWVCREQLWKRASEQAIQASGMPLEPRIGRN